MSISHYPRVLGGSYAGQSNDSAGNLLIHKIQANYAYTLILHIEEGGKKAL